MTKTYTHTERNTLNAIVNFLNGGDLSYTDKAGNIVEMTTDDVKDYAARRIASLDRKAAYKSDKPTARQLANDAMKPIILEVLSRMGTPASASAILAAGTFPTADNEKPMSVNRLASILSQMVENGSVNRSYDKRNALYSIA